MAQVITTTTSASPDAPATTEVVTVATKPGYKTTEFWLALAATLLSALFMSGAVTNNTVLAIAGIAATILTSLGYSVSRGMAKAAAK
jgi:hypothetical protein